jgi:septal ring-binding cell division protein DamX
VAFIIEQILEKNNDSKKGKSMKKQTYRLYNKGLYALIAAACVSLSSCQLPSSMTDVWSDDWNGHVNANETPKQTPTLYGTPTTTPTVKKGEGNVRTTPTSKVVMPPSYYLAEGKPVSHQTSDKDWVNKQEASGYTVELASGAAPAVAQTLQSAPKNEHMAQVQYDSNGQPVYVGVYGTYPTQEAAQAAVAKLPANLQSSATVQPWSNIQDKIQSSQPTDDSDSASSTSSIAPPDITDTSEATTSGQ